MNYTKYILVLILYFILISYTNEQKLEPINTGFIFIDGKYIEPPYEIELNNFTISMNNKVIYTYSDTINYKVHELPNYYEFLNDSSTLDDLFNKRIKAYPKPFFSMVRLYFLGHYHENDALDSIVSYCDKLPIIKEIKKEDWHGLSTFTDIHGNSQRMLYSGCAMGGTDKIYKRYRLTDKQFRNMQKSKTKKVYDKILKKLKEDRMIFTNSLHTEWRPHSYIGIYSFPKLLRILNSNISDSLKNDSISRMLPGYKYKGIFIEELKNNSKLIKRIKKILKETSK